MTGVSYLGRLSEGTHELVIHVVGTLFADPIDFTNTTTIIVTKAVGAVGIGGRTPLTSWACLELHLAPGASLSGGSQHEGRRSPVLDGHANRLVERELLR